MVVAIFIATLLISAGSAFAASRYVVSAVPGDQTIVSGCVIRFSDPNGYPSIHANGAHACAGIDSVSVHPKSGWLLLNQTVTDPHANPILYYQVQADETLGGKRGIIAGASGGTNVSTVALYDTRIRRTLDLRNQSDRMRVQGANSNLWVGIVHKVGAL